MARIEFICDLSGWFAVPALLGAIFHLMANHALPRQPIRRERARITLRNSARPRSVSIRRIDAAHANARRAWHDLGQPEDLSSRLVARLESASRLREDRCTSEYADRTVYLDVDLPPHAVASVAVTFQPV